MGLHSTVLRLLEQVQTKSENPTGKREACGLVTKLVYCKMYPERSQNFEPCHFNSEQEAYVQVP